MARYIINGGKELNGTIKVSGNKNAVFPCLAAALLTEDEVTLTNIPEISDVDVSLKIFNELGVVTSKDKDTVKVKASKINSYILPTDLTKKLRGSVVFVGGILGRMGKAGFIHPGGDIIGKRSIEAHLEGFRKLGFECLMDDLNYSITKKEELEDVQIFLYEPSVTATENLILASVLGSGQVTIKNCAKEPHVVDLCQMLISMGADIEGVGQSTIKISQVEKLKGTEFRIGSDYIEGGSYGMAVALTGGSLLIENFTIEDLEPMLYPLEKMGISFKEEGSGVRVKADKLKAIPLLKTNIWPGFPTDMMSLVVVLATQSEGVSLLHDWMYESRMFFVDKLISMGANITIADPHRVVVYGPTKLVGRELETPDIRAGMALVLAALVANGESTIYRAELIERGYANVVDKLTSLGADIKKLD